MFIFLSVEEGKHRKCFNFYDNGDQGKTTST